MTNVEGHVLFATTRFARCLLMAGCGGLALGLSQVAIAQDAQVEQQDGGLEEIIVTARKRAESSQNIPVSVAAFSAADIDRRDLTSLERIASATPQLSIGRNPSGSGAQISLRGIGSNSLSIGTEQSAAVIVDGVYYGQGRTINDGFMDLAGIEILKGPQSLFYGKNATAGVISITTGNPTQDLTAMGRVGYEFNGDKLMGEGYVAGPLSDNLGFRIAARASKSFGALFESRSGPITYNTMDTPTAATVAIPTPHVALPGGSGPNEKEFLVRGTLRWQVSDALTATLKANYGVNKTMPGTWNVVVFSCPNGVSSTSPNVPCERDFVMRTNNMPTDIAAETRYARSDGASFNAYKSWGTTLSLDYATDDISVTSVSNYNANSNKWSNDIDFQSSPTVNIWGTEYTKYSAFSSEFRLLSTFESPVNFLLGGYYQKTKRKFDQLVLNAGSENSQAPVGYRFVQYAKDSQTKGETLSAYGQLIWKVMSNVEATAGVRYLHETKDSYFVQPYANPRFTAARYDVVRRLTADQTFDNWSPEATLTWKPTDEITIYGAYRTAYKSGGFSNSSILTPTTPADFFTFDPEKAGGFEAGVKTTLADRQLRLNMALYSYKYTNLQLTYLDAVALSYNSINAGSVTTKGIEFDFEYAPRDLAGFSLSGSLNYNRARYGSSIAPCYVGQTIAEGCIPDALSAGTPGQNLNGVPTSIAPDWAGSLSARYDTDINDNLIVGIAVDSRYSASYFPSPFGSPQKNPSYVTFDATLRIATANERWELALLGKNLTNKFIVTGVSDAAGSGGGTGTNVGRLGDQVGFVQSPRTVQAQLTWRFQ